MLPLKSTRNKFIIATAILVVAAVGYGIFFSIITSTNKALATIDYELDIEVRNESGLKDLSRVIKNTETERSVLNTYFIKDDDVVDFINDLEGYAREVGVVPEIVFVDTDNTEILDAIDHFEDLNIEIKVKGSWSNVFHFAQVVDNIPNHLSVDKVSIINVPSKSEEGGPSLEWEGVFGFSVLKSR